MARKPAQNIVAAGTLTPGEHLRAEINRLGLDQVTLSKATGVSRQSINNVINNRQPISRAMAGNPGCSNKTKKLALIVSPESADPGAGSAQPVAIEADHISICKPSNRDSLVFVPLCRHSESVLKECIPADGGSSFAAPDRWVDKWDDSKNY